MMSLAFSWHVCFVLTLIQGHLSAAHGQGTRSVKEQCESGSSCRAGLQKDQSLLQVNAESVQSRLSKTSSFSLSNIKLSGRQLLVDGAPFHIKGINWNPIDWDVDDPTAMDFAGFVEGDADLMADAGINVVRTYAPLTDVSVLDALWRRGIWVMNTVYAYGLDDHSSAVTAVNAVKNHPAILMWVIGNEWNYNGIYAHIGYDASIDTIKHVADLVKQADPHHPVSTIYGGLPTEDALSRLSNIDVWGMNVYSGDSFGNFFDDWAARSGKPMYFGEYGADAYNRHIANEDQRAQAHATKKLTHEILHHSSVHTGGVCLGGILFEFADEWWKDQGGVPSEHDVGGIAPGGGPHPDLTFNEEWWGIVDIARRPRLAYDVYKQTANPMYTTNGQFLPPTRVGSPKKVDTCPMSRRRRQLDMCSCRRRHGTEDAALLEQGWKCKGPSIVRVH